MDFFPKSKRISQILVPPADPSAGAGSCRRVRGGTKRQKFHENHFQSWESAGAGSSRRGGTDLRKFPSWEFLVVIPRNLGQALHFPFPARCHPLNSDLTSLALEFLGSFSSKSQSRGWVRIWPPGSCSRCIQRIWEESPKGMIWLQTLHQNPHSQPEAAAPEGSKCLNPGLEELGSEIQYLSRPKIELGGLKAAQIPVRARENWELEFSLIPPGLIKCSQSIFHPGGFARAKTFRERSPGVSLEMSGQPN